MSLYPSIYFDFAHILSFLSGNLVNFPINLMLSIQYIFTKLLSIDIPNTFSMTSMEECQTLWSWLEY